MQTPSLVLFRKDLRVYDNPALSAAICAGPIIALYVFDDDIFFNNRQKLWAYYSIQCLKANLEKIGGELIVDKGNTKQIVLELSRKYKIGKVFCNTFWDQKNYDDDLIAFFEQSNIEVQRYNASLLLIEEENIKTQASGYYKTFTSYRNKCLEYVKNKTLPNNLDKAYFHNAEGENKNITLEDLGLEKPQKKLNAGEDNAQQILEEFTSKNLAQYHIKRHYLDQVYTSNLSINIHFGEISVFQIWQRVKDIALISQDAVLQEGARTFLDQILWREFAYYILQYYPDFPNKNLDANYESFPWLEDEEGFERWKNANTGYNIVDAGMTQLREEGVMPNRMRMIVASFLTKHLLIDWKKGAKWFLENLFDADIANNTLGWQWVAGSYPASNTILRIFNPILQQQRFDPDYIYVKNWIDDVKLEKPKVNSKVSLQQAFSFISDFGLENVNQPIVNHQFAVKRAKDTIINFLKTRK